MTDRLHASTRAAPVVVAARHRCSDIEVVVRWVERRPSSFAATSPSADLVHLDEQLAAIGEVRLDAPFAAASGSAVDGWRAPGRLVRSRVWSVRPFRVVVEIAPWSTTEVELRIAPRSRRALRRWGERRRRRYWGIAHDAADHLARELSPELGRPASTRPNVPCPTRDAMPRSCWDDTSRAPVHPLFLPADPAGQPQRSGRTV